MGRLNGMRNSIPVLAVVATLVVVPAFAAATPTIPFPIKHLTVCPDAYEANCRTVFYNSNGQDDYCVGLACPPPGINVLP